MAMNQPNLTYPNADPSYAPNYSEKEDPVKGDYEAQRGSPEFGGVAEGENHALAKQLKSRHMQMIAIGMRKSRESQ